MFTVIAEAADGVLAAQPGSLTATLTVIGVVAVLVAIAGLQALSMWRAQD